MPGQWIYAVVLLLSLAHVAALAYAYRSYGRSVGATGRVPGADQASADASADVDTDEGVECLACGAVNRPEFRFCRYCVADLPGPAGRVGAADDPESRRTL